MRVIGCDFTSRPSRRKPITFVTCTLAGDLLSFEKLEEFASFEGFEAALARKGPWVAGFDFPFGHARKFIEGIGWPADWPSRADHLASMARAEYRRALEAYKAPRPFGDREHARGFEAGTGAASPQKLYGVPVALMLFEGVPRLRRAGLSLPGLCPGDAARIAVEAYPGVLARCLIGRRPYKSDDKNKATSDRLEARRDILAALRGNDLRRTHGLCVSAPGDLSEPATADALDALLAAVQAAWAVREVLPFPGRLRALDPVEGWIADPSIFARAMADHVPPEVRDRIS
jgi:hypothetical protein